jgi:hypothetical protein
MQKTMKVEKQKSSGKSPLYLRTHTESLISKRKVKIEMKETNSSVRDNHEPLDIPRLFSSEAWKELTDKQVRLYLFCRWQYWAKKENRPGADYPDNEEYQRPEVFYLNWKKVHRVGLYGTNRAGFYYDVEALCRHGFIKRLLDGKADRVKSVYSLSDSWLDYRAEDEERIHKGA